MRDKEATGVPAYRGALSGAFFRHVWDNFLFRQIIAYGIKAEMATMDEFIDQLLAKFLIRLSEVLSKTS